MNEPEDTRLEFIRRYRTHHPVQYERKWHFTTSEECDNVNFNAARDLSVCAICKRRRAISK